VVIVRTSLNEYTVFRRTIDIYQQKYLNERFHPDFLNNSFTKDKSMLSIKFQESSFMLTTIFRKNSVDSNQSFSVTIRYLYNITLTSETHEITQPANICILTDE